MKRSRDQDPVTTALERVVPAVAGWRSAGRAFVNFLLFGLVLVAGEWSSHQIEYLIEFKSRFSAEMAGSPHHYYMNPLGIGLGVGIAVAALLSVLWLASTVRERHALVRRASWPAQVGWSSPRFPRVSDVFATAAVLYVGQLALYLVQENLEYRSVGGALPGLGVLFSPAHVTALPVHLLVAGLLALALRVLESLLTSERIALQQARALAGRLSEVAATPIPGTSHPRPFPHSHWGRLTSRAPPRAA